ncbi:MAG TPA: ECF transporter S component [Bacillota bacterium]|nr:ECF transporter S component [Bacillota bacterium]
MNDSNSNKSLSSLQVRKLTFSALYLAIAMVLPFLTGQIPEIGSMLCPMHLPALLCGFVCGWPWGLAVGFISPLLRSAVFGMPAMYSAIAMAFELGVYGLSSGLLYRLLPKKKWRIYAALIAAMILGRLLWGGATYLLAGLRGTEFTPAIFLAAAVVNAIPAIVLQLVLVPLLVAVHEKAGLMLNK